jgi:hypothetical protein
MRKPIRFILSHVEGDASLMTRHNPSRAPPLQRCSAGAAELAAHFEQAGYDRRAVRYLAEAAQTASRRHANAEAVGYVSRALDIAEQLPDGERVASRLGRLKQLGLLRRSMGAVRESIEDFMARARYAREHGRDDEEARTLRTRFCAWL